MAIEVGQRLLRVADLERTRGAFGEARTLPGEVYSSEDVLRLEQRGIFAREWLCVGREADIPKAGDWFLKEIAGDSVIVTRDAEGVINAFYNVCRHRGSRLLDEPQGHGLARILCPYHAWSYHLDGSLQNAPRMGADFCKSDHSLRPVKTGFHEGFIFLNLDQGAQPLTQ